MTCKTMKTGSCTINLLSEVFNIDTDNIRKLTLIAEIGSVTELHIERFIQPKDVDITSTEISRDTVIDSSTYEVTIKRIEPKCDAASMDIKPDLRCDADLMSDKA